MRRASLLDGSESFVSVSLLVHTPATPLSITPHASLGLDYPFFLGLIYLCLCRLQLTLDARGGGLGGLGSIGTALGGLLAGADSRLGCENGVLGGFNTGDRRCGAQAGLGLLGSHTELVEEKIVVLSRLSVRAIRDLSVVVASGRSSSTQIRSSELSGVLACQSDKFVALAALRDLDALLVEPLLDLALAPAVEKLIGETALSSLCR